MASPERRSPSSASGSWAGRWRPTSRARASRCRSGTARRARPSSFAAEHERQRGRARPPRPPGAAGAVITMVPDAPEVEEVLLGDGGAADALGRGRRCASTCPRSRPPPAARSPSGWASAASPSSTRPCTGSRPKAEDGTLTIMAGGAEEAFERARPLLEAMGELIVHVGPAGPRLDGQAAQQHAGARSTPRRWPRRIALAATAGLDLGRAARGGRLRSAGNSADARAQGRADARARLRAAVQARAHAQGRAPLPRRGGDARVELRRRRSSRSASTRGGRWRATAARTSPRS